MVQLLGLREASTVPGRDASSDKEKKTILKDRNFLL